MKRIEAETRGQDSPRILGWENHYSVKFDRCYVHITFVNRQHDAKAGIPLMFEELLDAFENRSIAEFASGDTGPNGSSMFCNIKDAAPDVEVTCREARAYIDERMNK